MPFTSEKEKEKSINLPYFYNQALGKNLTMINYLPYFSNNIYQAKPYWCYYAEQAGHGEIMGCFKQIFVHWEREGGVCEASVGY